jgi:hypothetical protein
MLAVGLNGQNSFHQSDGTYLNVVLHQQGRMITGWAGWTEIIRGKETVNGPTHEADVKSTIEGDRFHVTMAWRNDPPTVYAGSINAQAKLSGNISDRRGADLHVTWFSTGRVRSANSAPSPNNAPVPPKKIDVLEKRTPQTRSHNESPIVCSVKPSRETTSA